MKCMKLAIIVTLATSDNDRGLADCNLFDKVIAVTRNLLDSTDVQPGFAKNLITFQSCICVGNIWLDRDRFRAQFREEIMSFGVGSEVGHRSHGIAFTLLPLPGQGEEENG